MVASAKADDVDGDEDGKYDSAASNSDDEEDSKASEYEEEEVLPAKIMNKSFILLVRTTHR